LLESLQGRRIAAFCGIGNPIAFRRGLEHAGCQIVSWREFPDHHLYNDRDREDLSRAAKTANAEMIICTHKDLVKLPIERLGDRPLWALAIEMKFFTGEANFEAALERVIAPQKDRN
jgi:tetraacyldisaccharide 4'-kinase